MYDERRLGQLLANGANTQCELINGSHNYYKINDKLVQIIMTFPIHSSFVHKTTNNCKNATLFP